MIKTPLASYEGASGFILDWLLTGFFPNGTVRGYVPDLFQAKDSRFWTTDCLQPYGGEAAITDLPPAKGAAAIEWLPLWAPAYYPKLWLEDYRRVYPELADIDPAGWDNQYYALAVIESDTRQQAELRFCGGDGCRLWWNGQFLFEEHSWHKLIFDLHTVTVPLRRGRNACLMKLDRWGLVARLTAVGGGRLRGAVRSLTTAPPRPQPPGTTEQLSRYARTLKVKMPCRAKTRAQHQAWRRGALVHFRACMGPFPKLPALRPAELVECTPCEGYTRRRYHLTREAGSILPMYVLVPDADRFNGRTVICPHGHGQDDKTVAGVSPAEKPYGNWLGPWSGNYAEILARAGFLAATWSERALSHERRDSPRTGDDCDSAAMQAMAMGMTLPGLHLFDLHGVTDFVLGLPGADPRRLGLTGLSGGATMTYLAGAYDQRFKALAVFCGIHSYMHYARAGDGCGQQIVPGLFPTLDVGELSCLMAPRPVMLAQGRKDGTFNVFVLGRFAEQARKVYRLFDAADRVEYHTYDLAHQVDGPAMVDFFLRRL